MDLNKYIQKTKTNIQFAKKALDMKPPKVINYQANDICNLSCQMCNIWTKKKDIEQSPEELRQILKKPIFQQVEFVGITGGEPTLRPDLLDLYRVFLEELPLLKGASFITNGSLPQKAIKAYTDVYKLFTEKGLYFNGMVSIDGVGKLHDLVRGKSGVFERATQTFFGLKENNVPVIMCCTITKDNVYGLHELLSYAIKNDIYVRFRVAEFINRLYNENLESKIRNFDQTEINHLVAFFYKLINEYEKDPTVLKTYNSILSILTGGKRLIGCPYQLSDAINLDCRGQYAVCAPKGTPRPLSEHQATLNESFLERLKIRSKYCESCIHDYHYEWTPEFQLEQRLAEEKNAALPVPQNPTEEPGSTIDFTKLKHIVIAGWYGTETAGDIAILRGILAEYLALNKSLRFTILSLFPYYTRATVQSFPIDWQNRIQVSGYQNLSAHEALAKADLLVMGGGPLMDIPQVHLIASLFNFTHQHGKLSLVEGCGMGPLNNPDYRESVLNIVRLATQVRVRDQASKDFLLKHGIAKDIIVRKDPSDTYLKDFKQTWRKNESRVIRCYLRQLTSEYPQDTTSDQAEENIITFLTNLLAWYPEYQVELWPMHYFPIGWDDREFAARLAQKINSPRLTPILKPQLPDEILKSMAEAEFCVCMRFHSVVFAENVGAPYMAVDYTNGGKIRAFLKEAQLENKIVNLQTIKNLSKDSFSSKVFTPSR